MTEEKLFLLDTNVLIHDPKALFNFGEHTVGIPFAVLEELDQFKGESSDRGFAARDVIRELDSLRKRGFLGDGVKLDTGGKIRVLFATSEQFLPAFLDTPDNEIICTAMSLKKQNINVHFVSKDLNARVKADCLGIPTEDYSRGKVSDRDIYRGWVSVEAAAVQLKKPQPEELDELLLVYDLSPNEFVFLQARNNPYNFRIFRYLGGKRFKPVDQPSLMWPVTARNPQQLMALDLLFDPEVKMVSLIGPAGTGKTFLALLAGLHQILASDMYRKVLVSRPVIPLGPDIGFLPGDIQEKLRSWMQPMYDNIDFLAHAVNVGAHMEQVSEDGDYKRRQRKWKKRDRVADQGSATLRSLDQLVREGLVSLEAITYMRGRSIPYQYVLIDEVQNLSPHEVKTLVSRIGEGSKIILAGDPFQIDAPYLDVSSNGLVVATRKFKGQSLFGAVFLETSERSELSKLAGLLM
jgi:PhoH-like ATPase